MTKATIEDVINIAAGCGVINDTPVDRAAYRVHLRQEGARVAAAATPRARGADWLRRAPSADTPAAASTGQRSAPPVPPTPPTEYPAHWIKGRSVGASSGLRVSKGTR